MAELSGKDIRRQRVIDDFIRAAREILEQDGVQGVSARKVAERAGWSYATIYNYFRDINHLLWHCIPGYIADIYSYIQKSAEGETLGLNQLIKAHTAYVGYFHERPNIYKFMFLTEIGPPPVELADKLAEPVLGQGQEQVLNLCVKQGLIPEADIPLVGELLVTAVHGAMYMRATGKFPIGSQQLEQRIEEYIRYIMGRRAH